MIRFLCLFLLLCTPTIAQDDIFKDLRALGGSPVTVDQVIDPLTLRLSDGQLITLVGLHLRDDDETWAMQSLAYLRDKILQKSAKIYQTKDKTKGRQNRMGHLRAHVVVDKNIWLQNALLEKGLAQVRTTADNPEMATLMLAAENKARLAKIGVWATYKILTPETIQDKDLYAFGIVEGVVHGVALKNNTTYINFGSDWRTDFTVAIAAGSARRAFSKAGLDPLQWGGKLVRVRGWLRAYNGPYMEIDHPQAIEFLPLARGQVRAYNSAL